MHLLIFLDPAYKIWDASDIDSIVSAQIPDPVANPVFYNIITQSMVHGPCGDANPDAKCMVDGHCSKRFLVKILSMVMMVIQDMLGQTMGGPLRKMALNMTTRMLYLIVHISLQNTTAILQSFTSQ